ISIFSLIFTVLFFISPFYNNRYGEYKSVFKERPLKEKLKKKHKATDKSFAKFVEDNAWYFFIEPQLLDIYPVNNDKEFWQYIITRDLRLNTNYRIIKTDIYNRIFERNDNKFDYALGIGYNDVLTTERDYAMQVYYFGVVGVLILIGPFILSILYCCYRVLRYQQKFFKLDVLIVLMGNFIGIMVPYLTGHVFGIVFPMTYIVLNTLLILTMVRDDEKFVIEKEKAN
ncbi:MAG: O-antigen ligase family protein, partial [Bacilli bacterium]|nr:O-antigen ligase family protein [Bacilli bacterium]